METLGQTERQSARDVGVLIAGDAGQGVESGGAGFALAGARSGFHVFGHPDYRSRIRGGHNFYQVRLADRPVYSHTRTSHILVALTSDSVAAHVGDVAAGGAVVLPDHIDAADHFAGRPDLTLMRLPLVKVAERHGSRQMVNTGALAAVAALVGVPLEAISGVIRRNFAGKGAKVVGSNCRVAEEAYSLALAQGAGKFPSRLFAPKSLEGRLLMNGNQALALGALAGGCRFIAAYPMTPATTVFEWLAGLSSDYGVVAKQTEDEIAAVCMAIGASFAGARAMTATSGGGFCLMVEALGLAGMAEVPLVVVNAQRGGPSTGLPTRTEQADLLFAIHAGQGEFPRVVLAPSTVEECFQAGWRAFNLAEEYQCPVVILTDAYLASSLKTVDPRAIDFTSVAMDRGETLAAEAPGRSMNGYHRFEITPTGVSPRRLPGGRHVVRASSDEHDETGHISEDPENRIRMMQKRMRKLERAALEMRGPELFGPSEADLTLVCWGSTFGPCRDALELLNGNGQTANVLRFADLWPLPSAASRRALLAARRLVAVEQNYTGQLARLLRMELGVDMDLAINRYDGRPFSPEDVAEAVLKESFVALNA